MATNAVNQPVRFAVDNDFAAWLELFMSRKVGEDNNPGEINLTFVIGGEVDNKYNLTLDGANFGGADAIPVMKCSTRSKVWTRQPSLGTPSTCWIGNQTGRQFSGWPPVSRLCPELAMIGVGSWSGQAF